MSANFICKPASNTRFWKVGKDRSKAIPALKFFTEIKVVAKPIRGVTMPGKLLPGKPVVLSKPFIPPLPALYGLPIPVIEAPTFESFANPRSPNRYSTPMSAPTPQPVPTIP